MSKKTEERTLALPVKTFVVPADETLPGLSTDAVDMLDDTDVEGYEEPRDTLPYVSIRQKPLIDKHGMTIIQPGSFKMQAKFLPDVADVPGDKGLLITILADRLSRVYFPGVPTLGTPPDCRSADSLVGVGKPGGCCDACPFSQWGDNNERPPCALQYKIMCWDHNSDGLFYILNIGRSGLRLYDELKNKMKRIRFSVNGKKYSLPPHFVQVRVTTEYQAEPAPHFTPKFEIVGQLEPKMIGEAKMNRTSFAEMFTKTVATVDAPDEDVHTGHTGDVGYNFDGSGELPEGATPVEPESNRIPGI